MGIFGLCRLALLMAAGLTLAGCWQSSTEVQVDPNVVPNPAKYRPQVVELVTKLLDDPTNVRDAGITDPVLRDVGGAPRYMIRVRFNPRNFNRDYTGIVERVAYFYGGDVNQFVKAEPGQCNSAAYRPFPELEKVCRAEKCA